MGDIFSNAANFFDILFKIFLAWYWILPPLILWPIFKWSWLWWRRELWEKKQKYVLLEMVIPAGVEKPYSSMEHILSNVWSIYSNTNGLKNFRKKWIMGKKLQYFCFEIASVGSYPRFFIRMNRDHVDSISAAFYAQYPTMELVEVKDDYIKGMSWNVPNKSYDMYGFDEIIEKNDVYPIKTYTQFFELKPENVKEEKRVDPMNTLLEGLNKLHDGEQMWIQFRLAPVSSLDNDYRERGHKVIDKLIHRKGKKGFSLVWSLFGHFTSYSAKDEPREMIPPEMKLTPRERQIVEEIERKIGKNVFQTNIRCLYFGEKHGFKPGRKSLAEEYFSSFSLPDLNIMKKHGDTKTKIWHLLIQRRLFIRKRRMMRRYLLRETTLYPDPGDTFVLSIEEVATLFHPPIEAGKVGTMLSQIHSKKGEAPAGLPIN